MCIEREQPSAALKPMPAYGALNSSFIGSGNDRIDTGANDDVLKVNGGTGITYVTDGSSDQFQLDTGSGNDRLSGVNMWSPAPACISAISGPGGTTSQIGYSEAVGLDSSTVDVVNNIIDSLQPANQFI